MNVSADMATLRAYAELVERMHYRTATSESSRIAGSRTPLYRASRLLFLTAIVEAYPGIDPEAVYEVWSEITEPIANCVAVVTRQIAERVETALWNMEDSE